MTESEKHMALKTLMEIATLTNSEKLEPLEYEYEINKNLQELDDLLTKVINLTVKLQTT